MCDLFRLCMIMIWLLLFVYIQNTAHKVITQHVQGLTDTVDSPVNPLNQMGARAKRNSPNPRASPRYVKCMTARVYLFPIPQNILERKNSGPVCAGAETKKINCHLLLGKTLCCSVSNPIPFLGHLGYMSNVKTFSTYVHPIKMFGIFW